MCTLILMSKVVILMEYFLIQFIKYEKYLIFTIQNCLNFAQTMYSIFLQLDDEPEYGVCTFGTLLNLNLLGSGENELFVSFHIESANKIRQEIIVPRTRKLNSFLFKNLNSLVKTIQRLLMSGVTLINALKVVSSHILNNSDTSRSIISIFLKH